MYIEDKSGGLTGPARIGRVTFSKSKRSVYYAGRTFLRVGNGYKYNFIDAETGAHFWISGPKKNGQDALYASKVTPDIDPDVFDEYWTAIRGMNPPKK